MSEKDRAKKDHERKDKKNKAMRERENPNRQQTAPRDQAKPDSDITNVRPGVPRRNIFEERGRNRDRTQKEE
jgi:hypothetical protein